MSTTLRFRDPSGAAEWVFAGPGEVRARCRALDWWATALGPVEGWPQSLRTAVDICLASPDPATVLWGPRLVQIYNDAYVAVAGERHPALLGRPAAEAWRDGWPVLGPLIERVLADGATRSDENLPVALRRGGRVEERFFSFFFSAVRDEGGRVAGVFHRLSETTERVRAERRASAECAERERAEARLRESVARLRLALDVAELGTWTWDLTTGEGDLDARSAEIMGLPPGDLADVVGAQFRAVHPDDLARMQAEAVAGIEGGDAFRLSYRVVHPGGAVRHVAARARVLANAAGRPVRLVGTNRDVTAEREAEMRLRASEARYRALVENVQDYAIFLLDPGGVITEWAAGAARVTGYAAEEALGRGVALFYPPEDVARGEVERELAEAAETGRVERTGWRVRKDGTRFWADEIATAVRDAGGALRGFTKITRDMSEQRRVEQERERVLAQSQAARAQAESANRMKDEFLATVSHELRTPLNAILGWATMLQDGGLDGPAQARALATIGRNARAQTRLIEDLLDLSRILQGKVVIAVGPVELARVVEAALEAVRPAADAKGVRLEPALDARAALAGDAERLQQVAWNLLSNAIKFTPRGGRVRVSLRRKPSHVELAVADTGQGISADFVPHVFEPFRQADGGTARRAGGLGLGLSIVRSLVELHGGTVAVASEGEGRGATFAVRLPTAHARGERAPAGAAPAAGEAAPGAPDCPPSVAGLRVLVVEDEADTRALLAFALGQCGALVTEAAGAAEALACLERERFDVLVSDVGMPGEDGYSLLERVRRLPPERGGRTPAVALTAYARVEDRARALRAGFEAHLAKPAEPAELLRAVAALAGGARARAGV
ncbi:MAG TPA: ATP-binding protein [Polyangiaceae bacterium]|nr:ATP-binding protein [Polyangiaceae bacterium]